MMRWSVVPVLAIAAMAQDTGWEEKRKLARVAWQQGRYAESETRLREVVELREKELGAESLDLNPHLYELGGVLFAQMKLTDAEQVYRRAATSIENAKGKMALELAPALGMVARTIPIVNRPKEVCDLLTRCLAIRVKAQGPEHLDVATDLARLARFYASQKEWALAALHFQHALEIVEKKNGPDHLTVAPLYDGLGSARQEEKYYVAAGEAFRRALAIRESNHGPFAAEVAPSLDNVARALTLQKKFPEALGFYERSLMIWTQTLGGDHALVATGLDNLAYVHASMQQYDKAEPLYNKALEIRETHYAGSLRNAALVASAQDKLADAETRYKLILQLREQRPDELLAASLEEYAELLTRLKRPRDAAKLEKQLEKVRADMKK